MNSPVRKHLEKVHSLDAHVQNAAFLALMTATDRRVDWAYEVWDDLVQMLTEKDNHLRVEGKRA